MINAVLLDLYDTLVSAPWSELAVDWARRLELAPEDVSRGFDAMRSFRGRGRFETIQAETAAIVEACGIPPEKDLVVDLMDEMDDFLESQALLFSDTLATLTSLRAGGFRTAIVSNCSRPTKALIERLGLRDRVDQVVLSFEVGSVKPEPAIFHHTLSLLEIDTALFVDDQPRYLDGAAALGLSTVQTDPPRIS